MKLKKGYESDSGCLWFSNPWTESDWPLLFVIQLRFTEYWNEEWAAEHGPYEFQACAVSPQAAGEKNCRDACRFHGMDYARFLELGMEAQCEILLGYGSAAILWQKTGRNRRKLFQEAKKELNLISGIMFGFYMDRPMNAFGNTGWDFIQGDIGFKPADKEKEPNPDIPECCPVKDDPAIAADWLEENSCTDPKLLSKLRGVGT